MFIGLRGIVCGRLLGPRYVDRVLEKRDRREVGRCVNYLKEWSSCSLQHIDSGKGSIYRDMCQGVCAKEGRITT